MSYKIYKTYDNFYFVSRDGRYCTKVEIVSYPGTPVNMFPELESLTNPSVWKDSHTFKGIRVTRNFVLNPKFVVACKSINDVCNLKHSHPELFI